MNTKQVSLTIKYGVEVVANVERILKDGGHGRFQAVLRAGLGLGTRRVHGFKHADDGTTLI